MHPAEPNENGVVEEGYREVVAARGRAYAAATIALCADGLYRCGVEMHYAHGAYSFPISISGQCYVTLDAARTAALERLLESWHTPFPSDPESVRAELAEMHEQIEARLRQPTLF